MKKLLGFHTSGASKNLIANRDFLKETGLRNFQVFVSSPASGAMPKLSPEMIELMKNYHVIVHSPYWVTLSRKKSLGFNLKWVISLLYQAADNGLSIDYVTHLGYPDKRAGEYVSYEESIENTVDYLRKLLVKWPKHLKNTRILLETDSGSKNGNGFSGLKGIKEIVQRINDSRVGICYDTEHLYAAGEDDPSEEDWNLIKLVHLNSIPEKVEKGSHLDRHGKTLIAECKEGPDWVLDKAREAYKRKIPMILERSDMDVVLKDIEFMLKHI